MLVFGVTVAIFDDSKEIGNFNGIMLVFRVMSAFGILRI